jgi:hypothetical protein
MSTTISLAGRPPVLADLIAALAIADLHVEKNESGVHRFHIDGRSTRVTEVTVAEAFDVRMFSLAAPEDVQLAVGIAECAASIMGIREADAEGAGVIPVGDLRDVYDASWAESQARSGVRVLRVLIEQGRGPIQMPGPVRAFCVGPRVLAEVTGEDEHSRMLEAMRAVQWLRVRTAGVFVAGEKQTKLAVWLGEEVVFPPVAYAAVSREPEVVLVKAEHVPALAGAHWRQLDEVQGHIAEFTETEWTAVIAAARAFATKMD